MTSYALIADPDQAQASMYATVLRDEGLSSIVVKDGAFAAAALLERGSPEVLLTELSLARIDGFELIEKLRKSAKGDKTPVIVVSASRELRETAADLRTSLGISAILAKAASDESVRRVVKRILAGLGAAHPPTDAPPTKASAPDPRKSDTIPALRMPALEAMRRHAERGRT